MTPDRHDVSAAPGAATAGDAATARGIVLLADQASLAGASGEPEPVIRALRDAAGRSQDEIARRLERKGLRIEHRLWITNALVVRGPRERLLELARDPAVLAVEPDRVVPLPETREEPVATLEAGETAWSVSKISAPRVWSELHLDGTGVVVGIVDTGIDASHPDLAGKVAAFRDFVKPANTQPVDGQGHGTHTAGTIGGTGAGGTKTGVAPGVRFVIARVFTAQGATTANLLKAMEWVMDPDGDPSTPDAPRIVSNSWGSNSSTDRSFWNAVQAWRAAGMLPSFAAGNSGPRPGSVGIPGGYPHAFAAGATDTNDGIASFSSRGPVKWDGTTYAKPDVSAPGHGVVSCRDGGGYRSLSGTSMACPHVSGLAALLLSGNPRLTVDELEAAMKAGVVDLGASGHDNDFGTGRIDCMAAFAGLSHAAISGTVRGADGQPIAARVTLDSGPTVAQADSAGRYSLRAPSGQHVLVFTAHGYADARRDVTVQGNQPVTLDVVMEAVPLVTLSGRVVSRTDGRPIAATVFLASTPIPPVQAGADGGYRLRAPAGRYTLVARSRRYGVARIELVLTQDTIRVVELAPVSPVLLVNASGQDALSSYYERLLTASSTAHDVHTVTVHGAVDSVDLIYPYETVVWFSGASRTALPEPAQKAIAEYLATGGRLLLSGQDLSTSIGAGAFFRETLHARVVNSAMSPGTPVQGIGGDPIGHGLFPFSVEGGTGAGNQRSPDALAPADANAVAALRWQTSVVNRYAALRVTSGPGRVVYLGFGLEAVASDEMRAALLDRCMKWLKPAARERAERLARLAGEEREEYLEHLRGWLGFHEDGPPTPELAELAGLLERGGTAGAARDFVRRARAGARVRERSR
jgi:subtilisin family serine protease